MGMFDSLIDADGRKWQTKAFDCQLDTYRLGDALPLVGHLNYQVEVLGSVDGLHREFIESFATVRDGVLTSTHDARDGRLPLFDYDGAMVAGNEA